MTKMTGTLHDKPMYMNDIFMNSSYNGKCFRQSCRENQNIHFIFNFFLNCAIYEIMWIMWPGRPHVTTWRMRIACWISKVTNTNSEYVLLTAFPLQQ